MNEQMKDKESDNKNMEPPFPDPEDFFESAPPSFSDTMIEKLGDERINVHTGIATISGLFLTMRKHEINELRLLGEVGLVLTRELSSKLASAFEGLVGEIETNIINRENQREA